MYQNTSIMPRTNALFCWLYVFFVLAVPNGPADSDSEPTNQMPWKEGRQLLRKSVCFVSSHSQIYLSKYCADPVHVVFLIFLYVYEKVPGGGGIFRHHLGHALQTRSCSAECTLYYYQNYENFIF